MAQGKYQAGYLVPRRRRCRCHHRHPFRQRQEELASASKILLQERVL